MEERVESCRLVRPGTFDQPASEVCRLFVQGGGACRIVQAFFDALILFKAIGFANCGAVKLL